MASGAWLDAQHRHPDPVNPGLVAGRLFLPPKAVRPFVLRVNRSLDQHPQRPAFQKTAEHPTRQDY